MARVKATVVKGTENIYKIVVSINGQIQDHTLITSAEIRNNRGVTVSSSIQDPTDWDFTNQTYLLVKLGLTEISPGEHTCKLIIKTASKVIGEFWDTDIELTVLP